MRFILLPLAAATFIIGLHQAITVGIPEAYGLFMLTIVLILIVRMLRPKEVDKDTAKDNPGASVPVTKSTKGGGSKGSATRSSPTRRSR